MTDRRRALSPTGTPLLPLEKSLFIRFKKNPDLTGMKLIIGVSGGVDSVVLLYILKALQTRLKLKLHVVHVNHGVRGPAADEDSDFVKNLAKQFKIPMTIKKIKGLTSNASEALLREKRYEILFAEVKKLKANYIVTAHHRDDLLETRLMRLLHGVGLHGLRAMTVESSEGILRPLLDTSRDEIKKYAHQKNVKWRNDATNKDTTKFRNWIRRNWLGVLRREHPEYVSSLFQSLERIVKDGEPQLVRATEKITTEFRRDLVLRENQDQLDLKIYNYLRHHSECRITNQHVLEFKKQLKSSRKSFRFRLAGSNWNVTSQNVSKSSK